MKELDVKKKLYSQLVDLYDGIEEYIDENDGIIEESIFMDLPLDEALKEVFSYRDYVYTQYDLLNSEQVEMFDIELPDMDLRGYDLRNLHLTNYVPGTFDEEMNFKPSNVNLEGTNCIVNLNTAQYVQNYEGHRRVIDLRGLNLQGCNLYGRITENLGEGCHKRIIKGKDDKPSDDGREIDVLIGEKTLTESYIRRIERTAPLKVNERYTYERVLRKGTPLTRITKDMKLNDMDFSEARLFDLEQLQKVKQFSNNDTDISYTGAYIYLYGTHTLGKENYYMDLNKGLALAIKNDEDIEVIEDLIKAGADPNNSYLQVNDSRRVVDWITPTSIALSKKDPEKAKKYLKVLIDNGVDLNNELTLKTSRNGNSIEKTTLLDYEIARDYLWSERNNKKNPLVKKYPDLEERIKDADEMHGTVRKEEIKQVEMENNEQALERANKERVRQYLIERLGLDDKDLETIEKRDPEFFKKRTVEDDLDLKMEILAVNEIGKKVVLTTPKLLNHPVEQIFARTKFFSSEKIKVTPDNYTKTLFMPKTKFAEKYGKRLVKREGHFNDRQYTGEVDKKLLKKYGFPETREKLIYETRKMYKSKGEEK